MGPNNVSPGAAYLVQQEALAKRLTEKYGTDRKVEFDKLNEPVIWAKSPEDAKMLFRSFMMDEAFKMDFLSDITAYDNTDGEDGEGRFVLVYQQYSTTRHVRVRIKCLLSEHQQAQTVTDIFIGANWLEREVFDMYGITFQGHPNLRRILMDERFSGHPLRKEYPIKQREPFKDNIAFHLGANPLEISTGIVEEGEK
jgi:NADH-quinone oxidoreductase subunit C